jgi:V/A-type H+-transporting ATPase subunit I
MRDVEATDLVWGVVGTDTQYSYVVVIAEKAPNGMPVVRTRTGQKPLSQLQSRLEDVQVKLEDLQSERAALTKFRDLYSQNIKRLEDRQAFFDAFLQTHDEAPFFVLQGWAPASRSEDFQKYALEAGVLVELEEPQPSEEPPTLFENTPATAPGEGLVGFYMTPSYWLWDPSSLVLFSFALFFAMILGDAGYALVLALLLGAFWKKLGASASNRRTRLMALYLVGASLGWGVIVGSYFGVPPPPGSWLDKLKLLDINDMGTMMNISIVIGALHIAYANLRDGLRHKTSARYAPIGWAIVILACLALYLGVEGVLQQAGYAVIAIGALLILLFTGAGEKPLKRLMAGLMGFTGVSKAFGDILSYLRLFALGLASASLAVAFNNLAKQVADSAPGIGILFGLLILLIGHAMNLGLAIVSGFVHGLRLNLIEFFGWSIKDEGRPFRAFHRSETTR